MPSGEDAGLVWEEAESPVQWLVLQAVLWTVIPALAAAGAGPAMQALGNAIAPAVGAGQELVAAASSQGRARAVLEGARELVVGQPVQSRTRAESDVDIKA